MKTTTNIIQPLRNHLQPLALAVCAVLASAVAAQAGTITVGDSLIPTGLGVGDTFHFTFVTRNDNIAATSSDIADYNAHVQTVVGKPSSIVKDRGWTWKCIGSTATVHAKDNAIVSAPVYRLDKVLVANGYADFWDGSHLVGIYKDEAGVSPANGPWTWTGTQVNGTGVVGKELGQTTAVAVGDSWVNSTAWVNARSYDPTGLRPLYALSEPLTIVAVASDPYDTWAGPSGYNLGANAAKDADPDKDGQNNLMEFATNGDPTSGASGPRCYPLMYVIGADNALTYTMAVRTGATFAAAVSPNASKQTATQDGVVYLVEGTKDLTTWDVVTVTEVIGDDATAVRTALGAKLTSPALGSDWEWRTFRTAGGTPPNTNDFIRLKVDVAP